MCWEFESSPSVKFHSSHPMTLTHCFLNCLRCLITLSAQLILHKSEKMVVGGCQIRAIGVVWKNFPPHLCNCSRCEVSGVGASVVMQDGWWCFVPDVYHAMHDGACAVSGHNEQQWWFAQVPGIWPKSTPLHPRRLCPSSSQLMALSLPSSLMENANGAIPYSAVSFQAWNGETSFRHLSQYGAKNHCLRVNISAAVLRWCFSLTFVVFNQ